MDLSIFDLYSFAIGPSSSHTVGPMRAAKHFLENALTKVLPNEIARLTIELFGSLAHTGEGHGTVQAILAGFMGNSPENIDAETFVNGTKQVQQTGKLFLNHQIEIPFQLTDIIQHLKPSQLPPHPNTMLFSLYRSDGSCIFTEEYYSIGGGAIKSRSELTETSSIVTSIELPFPYSNASEMFALCKQHHKRPFEVALTNELARYPANYVMERLDQIYQTMMQSIDRGLLATGELPGFLKLRRRAGNILSTLRSFTQGSSNDDQIIHGYVSAWALAVAEENAAFGKIITSPTCGACGIIPATLRYYEVFRCGEHPTGKEKIIEFLVTAAIIGLIFKKNASIAGAEVGCQGEVGVACSMAAAALTAVLGGNLAQIEEAAKMGIIHFLGLTCDPIAGLVQIPCIERNAVAANQAISIANLALLNESYLSGVSLDHAITTMKNTGLDMDVRYKETSLAGLALIEKLELLGSNNNNIPKIT